MKDLKTIRTMIMQLSYILEKKQKIQSIGIFFVIAIGSCLELIGVSALLPFIQSLISPDKLWENSIIRYITTILNITSTSELVVGLCGIIILIYIVKNGLLILSAYLQAKYKSQLLEELSVQMLKSYMSRPYSFFVQTNSGEIMRGVTVDCAGVHDIIENLFKFTSEFLVVLFLGIYLFVTDYIMFFGIMIVGIACICILSFTTKRKVSNASKDNRSSVEENNNQVIQIVAGIKDIYVTGTRKHFLNRYKESFDKRVRAMISYSLVTSLPERIIETFCISGMLITVLIRIEMKTDDMKGFIASLGIFAIALVRMMPSVSRMTGYISSFIYNRKPLEACYENVKEARKNKYEGDILGYTDKDKIFDDFQQEISIENISWCYANSNRKILDGLSICIKKGKSIGIIGESGAGKSTLSDILLGLYIPQEGTIKVNGVSILDIPVKWSKLLGYVPQNVFLLNDSIRNNIIFGRNIFDDDKIWEVLKMAKLDDVVSKLPEQLDTIVGERGIKFSGGQRQRIAIARALYNDPEILILDEATSALDNDTEGALMEAIEELQGKKTLIIIAHRISTLKNCDEIYEIKDGKALLCEKDKIFYEVLK